MFKHPRDEANQQYTLVAVEHEGNQKDALGHGGGSKDSDIMYENMFEVIPATSVFRPPRLTPKPKILGTQTAVVSGPSSEEIHTDKFGRIKIKFPWDQSGTTENKTSCWCRVSHNLSGQGWGSIFIPRIGMEVLVTHLDADPDRAASPEEVRTVLQPNLIDAILWDPKPEDGWRLLETSLEYYRGP